MCGQGFGKLQQAVIPFSGIIHPEYRTAEGIGEILLQHDGQSDPGTGALRLVDQYCAAVGGCGVANQNHAQTNAEPAVLNTGLAQISTEQTGQ